MISEKILQVLDQNYYFFYPRVKFHSLNYLLSSANLYSKNDNTRDEAADGLLKLANKCSDVNSLESLLKHLFNVFHGSEGKLSLASQKISVLQVTI